MADKYNPKIKEELRNELRNFFQKKRIKIEHDIVSRNIKLKHLTNNQENTDYWLDDYLEREVNQSGERKYWMEFVAQLLKKQETGHLALKFLIAKEPSPKSYNYDEYNEINLELLKPYTKHYFNYINRTKWIQRNTDNISHVITSLDSQEQREELIKTACKIKNFSELKFKTQLYNIVQKNIRNKKLFEGLFPELENKNDDMDKFIKKIYKEDVVFVSFDINQINQYFSRYELGSAEIIKMVSDFTYSANKKIEYFQHELNIREIEVIKDDLGKKVSLKYYGNNLNEDKLKSFSMFMIHDTIERKYNPLEGDNDLRREELEKQIIQHLIVKTNKVYLQNDLSENTAQISRPKI